MIKVNREQNRGKGNYGWLKANYSFSFSQYYNPEKMGFKSLRVINEDFIAPGAGFPTHGHKNMEILTVVLKGSLGHTDSLGNIQTLKPGRIQRMYAGNGIKHSEFNASKEDELNLMQIWIEPNLLNLPPEYVEKEFDFNQQINLLASPSGRNNSIKIYQEVEVFLINLKPQESIQIDAKNSSLYIHNIKGQTYKNFDLLNYGDSLELEDESELILKSENGSLLLGFKFLK